MEKIEKIRIEKKFRWGKILFLYVPEYWNLRFLLGIYAEARWHTYPEPDLQVWVFPPFLGDPIL